MLNVLFNANSLHKSNVGRFEKRLILVRSIQSQIKNEMCSDMEKEKCHCPKV